MNKMKISSFLVAILAAGAIPMANGQSAFYQAVTSLNPAAYWPLQETAQPAAPEIEVNLGSLGSVGNAFYSSTNIVQGVPGINSGDNDPAIECISGLNGSFLAVPLTDSRVSLPIGPFSVEAWIYPTNSAESCIVAQTGPTTGQTGTGGLNGSTNSAGWSLNLGYSPALGLSLPGTVTFHVFNGVGSQGGAESTATPSSYSLNTWYHVVGVWDGQNTYVYVNAVAGGASGMGGGVLQPMKGSQARDTWDPLVIASGRGLNNNRFGGAIDEVAVYTSALTAAQVQNHYNAGTSGAGTYESTILGDSPYMYWRMDAPVYSTPNLLASPVAANYGTANANGLYMPGTTPGVSGPSLSGMGSPSYACAFNGIGGPSFGQVPFTTNLTTYSSAIAAPAVIITNLDSALNLNTSNISAMVWFKANPGDYRFQGLIGHGNSSWRLSLDGTTGKVHWNPGEGGEITSARVYNDGNWHFAVGVYTNAGQASGGYYNATNVLYVDGTQDSVAAATNVTAGSWTNVILGGAPDYLLSGNANAYSQRFFAGSLAHAAYFTNALTAAQVASLYIAAGGTPLAPAITGQPITGRTNGAGGNNGSGPGSYIYFGVNAAGATSYQWYYNSTSNYSGATMLSDNGHYIYSQSLQLTVTNLTDADSGYYYVVVANSYGSVTSILASLVVDTQPVITSQNPPAGVLSLYTGQGYTFSVATVGETNFSYQWFTNGVADSSPLGTNAAYSISDVQPSMNGETFQVTVNNSQGSATSGLVTLAVSGLPASLTNSAYSSNILSLNPAGYWPMHEVEAPAVGDVETNLGTLGSVANAYYSDWAGPITNVIHQVPGALAGDPDTAVLFNNVPDTTGPGYALIPRTSPGTTLAPPFTVEAWVKVANNGFGDIISQGPWNANNSAYSGARYGVRLVWNGPGFTTYVGPGTGTGNPSFNWPGTYVVGTWYDVVLSYDGNNWIGYVNGNQVVSEPSTSYPMGIDNADPLLIGQGLWQAGPQRALGAAVDEVSVYNTILSPSDVYNHYQAGITSGANPSYKQLVLNDSPLIYLRMNGPSYSLPSENTWAVMTNYGSVGINGVYSPNTTPGALPGPAFAGIPSGSRTFQGVGMGTYGDGGFSPVFNPVGATAFSTAAWFRGNPADPRAFQTIFGHSDNSFRVALNSAGKLQAHAGANDITSSTIYNDGNWHQYIETFTGTNTTYGGSNTLSLGVNTLYVDGVPIATNTGGANIGTNQDVMMGNDPEYTNNPIGTGRSLSGQVCEVAYWNNIVLTPSQVASLYNVAGEPPMITTQPTSASVDADSAYTNKVVATGSNPLFYQWYENNSPIAGQTSSSLVLNPVQASEASTNYYVVVSNAAGSVTSSVVTLVVYTSPAFVVDVTNYTYTNVVQLFAGATPTFKVTTIGALPTYYRWYTNGVAATANLTTLSNYTLPSAGVQQGGITSVYCIASNFVGTSQNTTVSLVVLPDPTAPYPMAVLSNNPIGYWRLNEPEQSYGNDGVIADDYVGADNGIYTNTELGLPGYSQSTDPSTTSAEFGFDSFFDGDAFGIGGIDFSGPTNSSPAFSVEAWVNAYEQTKDAGIVSKGYGGGGEQFDLDTGSDGGTPSHDFRFFVRDASGNVHAASSSIQPDNMWIHVVGVCDEPNGAVTLYVNGASVATSPIAPGSGILTSPRDMIIGSRPSTATTNSNDNQLVGNVNDVAVYNYALTAAEVGAHYGTAGVPPNLSVAPPSTITTNGYASLTIPVFAVGTPPLSYQWTDQNSGQTIASGSTNGTTLNATLNVPSVPLGWNGDTLLLQVNNSYGSTNVSIALVVHTNAPEITQDLPASVPVPSGKVYNYSIGVVGPQPYTYQWYSGSGELANQTNSTLAVDAGAVGSVSNYFVIVANQFGSVTSTVSTLTVVAAPNNAYSQAILALNPVGYWPLQETNAPAPVAEETNFGTLGRLGTAYYAVTNSGGANLTFGQPGALTATGDNDPSVAFASPSAVNYAFVPRVSPALTMTPPFSWELWLNTTSTAFADMMSEGGAGLNAGAGGGTFTGIRLSWAGNNGGGPEVQVYSYNGTGGTGAYNEFGTPVNVPAFGGWHHCVMTYDTSSTCQIYIDGQLEATQTVPLAPNVQSPLTIGDGRWLGDANTYGPTRGYTGQLDEVAVYTNVLSATQVTNHYLSGITAGSNYFNAILADHPLLYYRMDSAGYTNPPTNTYPIAINYGTAAPNGYYDPGTPPGEVAGPSAGSVGSNDVAAPINGVTSCIDLGNDPSFDPTGTQPFTAMTWYRGYPSDGRVQTIMGHGITNWSMNLDGTTGLVDWNLYNGGQIASTSVINDGNWHFLAGVFDGSHSYLYVDGALNASGSASLGLLGEPGVDLFLGGDADYTLVGSNQRYLSGAVAHAALFSYALSAAQIADLYTGTAAPAPAISVTHSNGQIVITYTGVLRSATTVNGPYTPVADATSPYTTSPTGAQMYYEASSQ